jgi:hypothetical protein
VIAAMASSSVIDAMSKAPEVVPTIIAWLRDQFTC